MIRFHFITELKMDSEMLLAYLDLIIKSLFFTLGFGIILLISSIIYNLIKDSHIIWTTFFKKVCYGFIVVSIILLIIFYLYGKSYGKY